MSYSNKKWYKPEKLSTKIIFALILIFAIRLLANIPVPFINRDYLSILFADNSAYTLLNNFSGGAFTRMTFMALGVTPYISASIILQLLCVTFPKLKDYQKNEYDQKRWKILTIIVSKYISKYCIGNGVSLILAANIVAELPRDVLSFWQVYLYNKPAWSITVACILFIAIVVGLIAFTIVLNGAVKEIPVVYSGNYKSSGTVKSSIPMKLNSAGVMPIIFTSTVFSLPLMFINTANMNNVSTVIYKMCNTSGWYNIHNWLGIIGTVIYFVLVIAFAYFYTAISFNPTDIANRLRKRGAFIPGIRPGKPTDDYLYNKNKNMTMIAAVLLFVLTQIPTVITCTSNIYSLSFGGTSVIIVVGVVLETAMAIKSELLTRQYMKKGKKEFFGIKLNQSI